ncbi:unnamed protein product, partial [Mesorhabditis belari]|uniref:Uncharacterized protein n=1 Tax=Mesorhabditis belari TaxID=2138241 RepID=A0AAF3E977_9BILA
MTFARLWSIIVAIVVTSLCLFQYYGFDGIWPFSPISSKAEITRDLREVIVSNRLKPAKEIRRFAVPFHGVKSGAGLGNQLFELFAVIGIANLTNRIPTFNIDDSGVLGRFLEIKVIFPDLIYQMQYTMMPSTSIASVSIHTLGCCRFSTLDHLKKMEDNYVMGHGIYFQSHLYSSHMRSRFLELMNPSTEGLKAARRVLKDVTKGPATVLLFSNDPVWMLTTFNDVIQGGKRTKLGSEYKGVNYIIPNTASPHVTLVISRLYCNVILVTDYSTNVRPVYNEATTTNVSINLNSFQLISLDQSAETITISAEFVMTWRDELLHWSLDEFNLTVLSLRASQVWRPDVVVSSAISAVYTIDPDQQRVSIFNDGRVRYSMYGQFVNICDMRVDRFPYDTQICQVNIGPWTYRLEQVHITSVPAHPLSNGDYAGNSEWELTNATSGVHTSDDTDMNFSYEEAEFHVWLKRRPQFYVYVLLVPTLVITVVAICGLFIPTNTIGEREERVNLGVMTLLSHSVILQIVGDAMPKTTGLPVLGNFILAEIFVTAVGVLFSVVVLTLHYRALTRKWDVPRWAKWVLHFPKMKKLKRVRRRRVEGFGEEVSGFLADLSSLLCLSDEYMVEEESDHVREVGEKSQLCLLQISLALCPLTIFARRRTKTMEALLTERLFDSSDYSNEVRPVYDETTTTNVSILLNQFRLLYLDQSTETVKFMVEFVITWKDEFLIWNVDEYNLTEINVKEDRVWRPDIVISSSVSSSSPLDANERYVNLESDGTVTESMYGMYVNVCQMQVDDFPYDSQNCAINIGPWNYRKEQVHIATVTPTNWDYYLGNSEWDLENATSSVHTEEDTDVAFYYEEAEFIVKIKRRPQFYIWVLLIPTFIITMVSLFGLFIPTNTSGEREQRVSFYF